MGDLGATPLGQYLLIEADPLPDEIHGIHLPQQRSQRPASGVIHAAGPHYDNRFGKVGDRVIFGQFSGIAVRLNERPFLLMDPSEILARMDKDDPLFEVEGAHV